MPEPVNALSRARKGLNSAHARLTMGVRRSVPALEACMVTARRTLRPRTIALLAGLGVALGGCFDIPTYSDFQLNISPFDNTYLNRGEATMEVWLMPGYTCPDEETARLYLVYSNTIETPAPLALVLHAEPFDYVRSDGTAFSSQVGEERLTVDWAALTAEKMMGIRDSGAGAFKPGALVASLVREGFYVVVPTNCWGTEPATTTTPRGSSATGSTWRTTASSGPSPGSTRIRNGCCSRGWPREAGVSWTWSDMAGPTPRS